MTKTFKLDTEGYGADEILEGDSREEVLADVLYHHELETLPDNWTLKEIPVVGDAIRFSADGLISMVWCDGEPVRCPTQEDMDTLPVGADMTDEEVALLEVS